MSNTHELSPMNLSLIEDIYKKKKRLEVDTSSKNSFGSTSDTESRFMQSESSVTISRSEWTQVNSTLNNLSPSWKESKKILVKQKAEIMRKRKNNLSR